MAFALSTIEYSIALALAPFAVCENSHALRLCSYQHKRKAWLISQTKNSANTSAVLYSIIETAKANNIKPYDYLMHVMKKMMQGDVESADLLPWKIKLD